MESDPGLDTLVFDTVLATGDVDTRGKLARELAGFSANPETIEAERRAVIPAILKLAADPVFEVRRMLAEGLTAAGKIEPEIVFTIVADQDEIALPFLSAAVGLDSPTMVAVARVGDLARQMQVALRNDVSPDAVSHIAAKCVLPVCVALLDNPAAPLDEQHFRLLYARFGRLPQIVERLLPRERLPLDIRIQEARRTSNRVHRLIAERGWVAANDAAEIVADAEETAMVNILTAAAPEKLQKVMPFLTAKNILTPSIVMRAACLGEMKIVETALAHLCDMSAKRVARLIYGRGPVSLRALYRKAGLPAVCFGLLRGAIDVTQDVRDETHPVGAADFGRRLVEAIMTRYEAMSIAERNKQLELVSRFAEQQVRLIALGLMGSLVRAA
jgi:uncharacterized protein (DUF2336 family)